MVKRIFENFHKIATKFQIKNLQLVTQLPHSPHIVNASKIFLIFFSTAIRKSLIKK